MNPGAPVAAALVREPRRPWKLRRIPAGELRCRQQLRRLVRAGYDAIRLVRPSPGARYLQLDVECAGGAWRGWMPLEAWLASVAPEWAALGSAARPVESMVDLFGALPRAVSGEGPWFEDCTCSVRSVAPASSLPDLVMRLPLHAGTVCCEALPESLMPAPPPGGADVSSLPVRVDWLLGRSSITRRVLRRMRTGDVVLITSRSRYARAAGSPLFEYSVMEEGMIVEGIVSDERDGPGSHPGYPGACVNLDRLAFDMEFVLQQRTLTLAELRQVETGQVFPLDADASMRVGLRVNGQLVARGELVQLDAGLGVEVSEIYLEPSDV